MSLDRRTLILATGAAALPAAARAQGGTDPRMGERSVGPANAPVTVQEFFSLTCPHCAAFHRDTYPQVKRELVDGNRMRLVWRDFPLDQVALRAAVVARSFPADRYEPFIAALFAAQDRWAFARGADHKAEIGRIAALAGMPAQAFEAAWGDDAVARFVLEERQKGEREWQVNSTPTFVFGRRAVPGALPFDRFAQYVQENSDQ